jgi:hypothetical protein
VFQPSAGEGDMQNETIFLWLRLFVGDNVSEEVACDCGFPEVETKTFAADVVVDAGA